MASDSVFQITLTRYYKGGPKGVVELDVAASFNVPLAHVSTANWAEAIKESLERSVAGLSDFPGGLTEMTHAEAEAYQERQKAEASARGGFDD